MPPSGSYSPPSFSRFDRFLLGAYCLNVVDVILTIILCINSGMIEVNPIMAYFLEEHPALFAAVKLGILAWVLAKLKERNEKEPHAAHYVLGVVTGLLIFICVWQTGIFMWSLTGD